MSSQYTGALSPLLEKNPKSPKITLLITARLRLIHVKLKTAQLFMKRAYFYSVIHAIGRARGTNARIILSLIFCPAIFPLVRRY